MTHALAAESPKTAVTSPLDAVEAAAQFLARQPDGPERTLAKHQPRENGDCSGCGWHRTVRWPCVLVDIAHRTQMLTRGSRKSRTH